MFTLDTLTSLNPVALMQYAIISGASLLLFLLLFTLRDILLRTRSFWFQAFCVLLTGALPIIGFLIYLLIRPARTVKERELEALVQELLGRPLMGDDMEYADDAPSAEESEDSEPEEESTQPTTL